MTATTTQYASPAPASSSGGSTATFRTIRRTFWTDPYIESMPPARKLLYIYLFTSPHTNNLGVLNTTRYGKSRLKVSTSTKYNCQTS